MRYLTAVVLLPLVLGGCLISSNVQESHTGNYVPTATFAGIKPNETSAAYVEATLGKPTSVTPIDDGSEIWRYSYTESKKSSGHVFLIFGGASETNTEHSAYVQIKEGKVLKAWRA